MNSTIDMNLVRLSAMFWLPKMVFGILNVMSRIVIKSIIMVLKQKKKGQPFLDIPLPKLFEPDEWKKISKFNYKTTERIHDGFVPLNSKGKAYIVIPHAEYTEEMISFLKYIGVRARLFNSHDDLEVKDEDVVSVGASEM